MSFFHNVATLTFYCQTALGIIPGSLQYCSCMYSTLVVRYLVLEDERQHTVASDPTSHAYSLKTQ